MTRAAAFSVCFCAVAVAAVASCQGPAKVKVGRGDGPCRECALWDPLSCGAGLSCQEADLDTGPCVTCGDSGTVKAAGSCNFNTDCIAGFGCAEGRCRPWCDLAAPAGKPGACRDGGQCISYRSLEGTGAGVCLPCGECEPAPQSCGVGLSCSTTSGCAVCHAVGVRKEGEVCAGHLDCARGLSCVSQVCRANCLVSAAPGQPGACEPPARCDASDPGARNGTCVPCGECNLFGAPTCLEGFKCSPHGPGCAICIPAGSRPTGQACTDHSQCMAGQFCVDDVCRPYCAPAAAPQTPGACATGTCVPLTAEPDLGQCLSCGECGEAPSKPCPTGFGCTSYNGCKVCTAAGMREAGEICDEDRACRSFLCLDRVCRDTCGAGGACAGGTRCRQVQTTEATLEVCVPCNECDILAATGCSGGSKCIAKGPDCTFCIPSGPLPKGSACEGAADCVAPLNCANGVCRPYCSTRNPATCTGTCFGSTASLPAGVGQCLACGECMPWSGDSCAPAGPDLTCNQYSGCAVCEWSGGPSTEGQSCQDGQDCIRDLHCVGGLCRNYCKLGAAPGSIGTCAAGRICRAGDSNLQSLSAGVCLP